MIYGLAVPVPLGYRGSDRQACWARVLELEVEGLDRDEMVEKLVGEGWSPPVVFLSLMRLRRLGR